MSSSIAAVVFDMDGLLLDTERLSRAAWRAGGEALGVTIPEATLETIIGRRRAEVEAEFRAALGDAFDCAALYAKHAAHYHDALDATPPERLRKPGVLALFDWIETRGIPFAVATSTLAAGAAHKLALAGLASRVRIVVSGDQVPRSKPAPDIFLEAAARLGVDPRVCVAFEDSDLGLAAALDAGMRAVAIPDLKPLPDAMRTRVDAVLTSLEEAIAWLAPRIAPGDARD